MMVLLMTSPWAEAQNGEDVDDEKPPAETEIICYAAKNKWVCAPADEKEKAHEKAMRLAEQSSVKSSDLTQSDVDIRPLDSSNNLNQQVQESPAQPVRDLNSLAASIRDFTPREDVVQTEQALPQPAEPAAVVNSPIEQSSVKGVVTETDTNALPDPAVDETIAEQQEQPQQPAEFRPSTSNNFSEWQRNHPNQWSFQVVGTSNRHHLNQFIIDQGLDKGPYAVVKTQVNGADWWVVLSGLYDSREQALSQRSNLPSELAGNAWVRQISTIIGQAD